VPEKRGHDSVRKWEDRSLKQQNSIRHFYLGRKRSSFPGCGGGGGKTWSKIVMGRKGGQSSKDRKGWKKSGFWKRHGGGELGRGSPEYSKGRGRERKLRDDPKKPLHFSCGESLRKGNREGEEKYGGFLKKGGKVSFRKKFSTSSICRKKYDKGGKKKFSHWP